MGRTAEKATALMEEDAAMADALAAVLRAADERGEVAWVDVKSEITSGQWGRIIQTGILVEGSDGFVVKDVDEVRTTVEDSGLTSQSTTAREAEEAARDDEEDTSWTQWDKAAGLATVLMFVGYWWNPARDLIGGTMDTLIGPIDAVVPFYATILVLALVTGLYSALLQANLMDTSVMGEHQEKMKGLQERRKKAKERDDEEELDRIQEEQMEMMGDQIEVFKAQFRPMVWIMLFTIPVFLWLYWRVFDNPGGLTEAGQIVFPIAGELENGWRTGVIGPMQAWIVWYVVCSIAFAQVVRKTLNINLTPTST